MSKFKKISVAIVSFALAVMMCFALTACGGASLTLDKEIEGKLTGEEISSKAGIITVTVYSKYKVYTFKADEEGTYNIDLKTETSLLDGDMATVAMVVKSKDAGDLTDGNLSKAMKDTEGEEAKKIEAIQDKALTPSLTGNYTLEADTYKIAVMVMTTEKKEVSYTIKVTKV